MTQQKNPPKFGELQGPNKTRRENNERAKPEDQKPEAFEAPLLHFRANSKGIIRFAIPPEAGMQR